MSRSDKANQTPSRRSDAGAAGGVAGGGGGADRRKYWRTGELLDADFADGVASWLVPGLLGPGLVVLGGKPKAGKSLLGVQIAVDVARGADVLGRPGGSWSGAVGSGGVGAGVLYLGLEDSAERIRRRMVGGLEALGLTAEEAASELRAAGGGFHLFTEWARARGVEGVREWLTAARRGHESGLVGYGVERRIGLVVVDVLARFAGRSGGGGYARDYALLGELQQIGLEFGVCVLVITHVVKSAGRSGRGGGGSEVDMFSGISGSSGVMGAADTLMVLESRVSEPDVRRRGVEGDQSGRLWVRGRDVDDQRIDLLLLDGTRWVARSFGGAGETDWRGGVGGGVGGGSGRRQHQVLRGMVRRALRGGWDGGLDVAGVVMALELEADVTAAVERVLRSMLGRGEAEVGPDGRWTLTAEGEVDLD
jgi:AAA domain